MIQLVRDGDKVGLRGQPGRLPAGGTEDQLKLLTLAKAVSGGTGK